MKEKLIGIVGLGYVGLPLAICFSRKYNVIGFDIDKERINDLKKGFDKKKEIKKKDFKTNKKLIFTTNEDDLSSCNIYIITTPTPIDEYQNPDLSFLVNATKSVGKILKKKDIVIVESTVHPGATEEICIPILSNQSGLTLNSDYFVGYSPERINPGDKINTLDNVKKVVSASNTKTLKEVSSLYRSILKAGVCEAASIKVAEAAKIIENTQRDINIAFVNELAKIFNKLDIDTTEVLRVASTKWNFLQFQPGLVGGHCIGVDPYYLAQKAQSIGYYPEMILSGRRVNDGMGDYISKEIVKLIFKENKTLLGHSALILGITFKENFNDIRNSKVVDIIKGLEDFNIEVDVCDPLADKKEVQKSYGIELKKLSNINLYSYSIIVLAVKHNQFKSISPKKLKDSGILIYDVKSFFEKDSVSLRL